MPVETIPNQDDHSYYYLHELRGREIVITGCTFGVLTQYQEADGGYKPAVIARFYTHDRLEPADGLILMSGSLGKMAQEWVDNPRSPDYLVAGLLVKRRPFPTALHERWELIENRPADV